MMPTTRPRHTLTETEELSAALELAAHRWPEDAQRPSRLLLRLVKAGEHAIAPEQRRARERRRRAVERHHGQFTGIYPSGYLEKLRSEWPD
jgi:hypothetical protein